MKIDTEELLIELHELGIDTEFTLRQTKYVVELSTLKDNTTLGVASGETLEKALAVVIRRLADDSKRLKEMKPEERLSLL